MSCCSRYWRTLTSSKEVHHMSEKTRIAAIAGLLLFVSTSLLVACGDSGSIQTPDGPYMLYFYAKW